MSNSNEFPKAYACKHRDLDVRMESRSGGVFTAVSDIILDNGGVIYGCALDENFVAVHKRATTPQQRNDFRKSKYVQSDMGDTFLSVKNDLKNGLEVLFSGTPCQVDGLIHFLSLSSVPTDKLLTMDLVCHGVPSPKLWRDYLKYQENKHGKILNAEFRNKRDFGWKDHVETLEFKNGKLNSKIYTNIFYKNYALRRSCHECNYTSKKRVSDLTLADFWGIDLIDKEFNDNKGVSLILVNSEKGSHFFDLSVEKNMIEVKQVDIDDVNQKSLNTPYIYTNSKEVFWDYYDKHGFKGIVRKYAIGNPIVALVKKIIVR